MEVINAVVSAPTSLHKLTSSAEKKAETKRALVEFKLPKLVALSSALGYGGLAKALTYEEALDQTSAITNTFPEFDVNGFIDRILNFTPENPVIVGGGALVFAVPLIVSQILNKLKKYGVESAKNAYGKLSEDANAQLLDIREGKDIKLVGSPDIRSLKKKAINIAYKSDDKQGFLKKLALRFKDPANTTLFVLDKYDGNSELVAELVTANGFKAAYAIKDGAEGRRGWVKSNLPWLDPKKASAVDLSDIKDAITDAFGEGSDGLPVTLGLAAFTGLGLLAFTEIETVLQLLGSAALIQLFTKKLLYAEDRKVTLRQIDEFLNTKIAPKELAGEIKTIGDALLPLTTSTNSSPPAPADGNADTVVSAESVELKGDNPTETPSVNSVSVAEVEEKSIPATPRPLSPYPSYPDFKPPSSPSPSAP